MEKTCLQPRENPCPTHHAVLLRHCLFETCVVGFELVECQTVDRAGLMETEGDECLSMNIVAEQDKSILQQRNCELVVYHRTTRKKNLYLATTELGLECALRDLE